MFSKNFKAIRLFMNLSQEEFGKLLFASQQTVDHWEHGRRTPDVFTFERVIRFTGIEISLKDFLTTDISKLLQQKVVA